jgi:ophiobolin F synthase
MLTTLSGNTLAPSNPKPSSSTTVNLTTPLQPPPLGSKAQLQARIAYTLLSISPTLGAAVLEDWKEFAAAQGGIRKQQYPTLDSFLETRIVDTAAKWVFTLLRFGLDLHLTDSEKAATAPMERQLSIVMALQNDYFSFDKEHAAWRASWTEAGEGHQLINALTVVMRSQDVTLNEARAIVRSKYQEAEKTYVRLRDEYIATGMATPSEVRWSWQWSTVSRAVRSGA